MMPGGDSALADIHSAFADPVTYTVTQTNAAATLAAVRSSGAAEEFLGAGRTARFVRFEIRFADFDGAFPNVVPVKGDTITEGLTVWRVNEVVPREDVLAWGLGVEKN